MSCGGGTCHSSSSFFGGGDKVVGLVGGGSVINGPIPSRFTAAHSKYLAVELSYGG